MESKRINAITRRQFIRQMSCAAVGTAAITSTIRDLRFMNAAMAGYNLSDYKALVCIFLAGGNDSNNLVVPTIQSEWNSYQTIRTSLLALPLSGAPANQLVIPLNPSNHDGHNYGLHPACSNLAAMFNQTQNAQGVSTPSKLALLFNVGTLVFPMTRAQYLAGVLQKPPQLFSHADQVSQWQTSIPDQAPLTGWGGRCADLLASVNTNAPVSMAVTLAGANTFEIGNIVSQYSVSTSGAISLSGLSPTGNPARYNAMTNILGLNYPNLQGQAYANVALHSLNSGTTLNNAITNTANNSMTGVQYWTTPFPASSPYQVNNPTSGAKFNSSLGPQLEMIARLIEAGSRPVNQGGFGMKRQVFFCSIGGYDLHTNQAPSGSPSTGSHSNLLAELDQCLWAFAKAMDQIATLPGRTADPAFPSRVTAFTASDFSRTFQSNGQGTDHGWGSHHLIMGGAVNGQQTYGTFPSLVLNGPDDASQSNGTGRWIPTTATDQYYATLASWFGISPGDMPTVFPNIGRFSNQNLLFV